MTLAFIDPATLPFVGAFIFVFAVVFGGLTYTGVLGGNKNVNVLISIAFAIFAVLYEPFVASLQAYIPFAAVVMVIAFFILFLKKVSATGSGERSDAWPALALLAFAMILLGAFWDKIGFSMPGISSENMLWLIGIAIIALIFWVAYKTPPAPR